MNESNLILDDGVVAGNVYDKYTTRNPIARRLMQGFLDAFRDLVREAGAREAHEVGCGEGRLSVELTRLGLQVRASDFSAKIIEEARNTLADAGLGEGSVGLKVASIYELAPPGDAAELVVCCEVMEHLDNPAEALAIVASLARPYAILSVPREPIWRVLNMLRGRYLRDFGNTPGHLQHWSKKSFLHWVAERFEIVATRSPLPWTMALGRARAAP